MTMTIHRHKIFYIDKVSHSDNSHQRNINFIDLTKKNIDEMW